MYLLAALLPAPRVTAPAGFLRIALDAERDEPARVAAIRQLHGVVESARHDVARALVVILNEPLAWLPSEALSFIALTSRVLIGAQRGRFVACPTSQHCVADADRRVYCPDLGRVVLARDIAQLDVDRDLPWLRTPRTTDAFL